MRLPLLFCLALLTLAARGAEAAKPLPALTVDALSSPAPRTASSPALAIAPDGIAWLSWVEPVGAGAHALVFSTFDAAGKKWSAPRRIATGRDWFVNWADTPALTHGPGGQITAVFSVNNPPPAKAGAPAAAASHDHDGPGYHARVTTSRDRGQTWSAPQPLTSESDAVEFASLATLADGRVIAAWLDGRGRRKGGKAQQLYARILGAAGPAVLVDDSVCDCCPTALTTFPDGSALLAYRGRSAEEARDIRVARFDGRAWAEPRTLNVDDWRLTACPVNGPRIVSDGGRVGVAWFTGADNDPRVLTTFSPDAGTRFLMPLRVDAAKPIGHVDTLLLRDSALLTTWVAADGGVWLRRVSPDLSASVAVEIAPRGTGSMKTITRAALVRDYRGGDTAAQVLVAFTTERDGVRTALVNIPEGALLEAEKNCDCQPTLAELQGFPMRGTIVEANASAVRVRHPIIAGLFAAGTHDFAVAPELLAQLRAGRQFLGRIEKRDERWWLFDVRFIAEPAK